MNINSVEMLPMREGLLETKKRSIGVWNIYSEGILLISGLPGTGKSTLIDVFAQTNMGGALQPGKIVGENEIPYLAMEWTDHPSSDIQLHRGIYPQEHRDKLFVAAIAGAYNIQRAFADDPRLLVVHLHCHLATRALNLLTRMLRDAQKDYNRPFLGYLLRDGINLFRVSLFPNDEIRIGVENTKPDIVMNTSIGSRVNLAQARKILSQSPM